MQKHCKEQCVGYFPCSTKVGRYQSHHGRHYKKMKFFCGLTREAPKPAMERAQEPSIQQLKQQVMSVVQLSLITSCMAEAAKRTGLPGHIRIHSVRKSCVSRLMDAEVPVNYVAQLSGHKNLKSLDSYKVASFDHQRHMSLVLSLSTNEASHGPSSTLPTSSMIRTTHVNKISGSMVTKSATDLTSGLFSGASIQRIEGCSFTFNISNKHCDAPDHKVKKRMMIVSDDSDSE